MTSPLLIVGLGNPSPKYDGTRHNVGRQAVMALVKETSSLWGRLTGSTPKAIRIPGFAGKAYRLSLQTKEDAVAVPDLGSYMNTSGPATEKVRSYLKIPATNVVLVHDDTDLPLSELRVSRGSSSAGHNGVQSVIDTLGTKDFTRIRIGIETRENKQQPPTEAFVLQ